LIGIRIPINAAALSLLKFSDIPIAAPIANDFSHVSPTKNSHISDDFKDKDHSHFFIIEGEGC
jgi:L-threonylcarbamoyladenylate synthase